MRHKLASSFAFTDFVKFEPRFMVCTGHSNGRLKIFTYYVKNRRFEDLFKELRGVRLRFSSYIPSAFPGVTAVDANDAQSTINQVLF